MVAARCRRLARAARWNGQAHQVTTGATSAATTHCQPAKRSGMTIAISSTGTVSAAATTSRAAPGSPCSVPAAGPATGTGAAQ
jgi:hypothetical protein